jgi:hypothetical protein
MQGSPQFTSPPWNESAAFRETMLIFIEMVVSYCASWSSDLGSALELR